MSVPRYRKTVVKTSSPPAFRVALAFLFLMALFSAAPCGAVEEPPSSVVAVFSCLDGASVEIDGVSAGTTVQGNWARFEVQPGNRRIVISDPKGDFRVFSITVSPISGETIEVVHIPESVSASEEPERQAAPPGVLFLRLKGGKP